MHGCVRQSRVALCSVSVGRAGRVNNSAPCNVAPSLVNEHGEESLRHAALMQALAPTLCDTVQGQEEVAL